MTASEYVTNFLNNHEKSTPIRIKVKNEKYKYKYI